MLPFLKDHPFAVEAYFERSIVLTFAVPKDALKNKIPPCLELDVFDDKWAFIAVALVYTHDLRPKGFPKFCGNSFFLTGYRIFVRYTNAAGKRLRGLYILKSETNIKKMEFLGNIFTHYHYTTTDISIKKSGSSEIISSKKSAYSINIDNNSPEIALPKGSPFTDWKQARRYAGPLPFTFTYNNESKEVLIIEGVRQNWDPKPLSVQSYNFAFLDSLNVEGITLANAFEITNIPYHWKKGRKELWKQQESHFRE